MAALVPSCVWRAGAELLLALDSRFGEPNDTYVNGSQVWLRDDGPGAITLEWRLHPVPGYVRPKGVATEDVLPTVVFALSNGDEPVVALDRLWEGLEVFPAYDDDIEPAVLAAAAADALGLAPEAFGLVDHAAIGDEWERTNGGYSVVDALFDQLVNSD
ncbi:MAG: hypothetical protein AB7L13_00070 [Acidimicrobiia bacterium]